jgi:hypothetical protein
MSCDPERVALRCLIVDDSTSVLRIASSFLQRQGVDQQQPLDDAEVYVVLEGWGMLEVEGESVPMAEGAAVFVEVGAERRFTALRTVERARHLRPARCGKPVVASGPAGCVARIRTPSVHTDARRTR